MVLEKSFKEKAEETLSQSGWGRLDITNVMEGKYPRIGKHIDFDSKFSISAQEAAGGSFDNIEVKKTLIVHGIKITDLSVDLSGFSIINDQEAVLSKTYTDVPEGKLEEFSEPVRIAWPPFSQPTRIEDRLLVTAINSGEEKRELLTVDRSFPGF